uniref:Uncharacterized protein n=1 Tax=Romanomermis culicivorax TaxID=13658 RepID=A0A915KQX8_ROMCU
MMMVAFGKMIVAWCYDNGLNLAALNEHNECLSMAMFDSMTTQGCLFNVLSPMALAPANSDANVLSGSKIDLMKLLNNIAI